MSRKLLYIIVSISITASILVAASVPAGKEPVYFGAGAGEVTIGPKQYAVARTGWVACSKGMVQDFMDHFVVRLELYQNDTLLQTVTIDQGDWVRTAGDPSPQCLHVNEPETGLWQFDDLDLKEPGTYTLWFYREQTVPLADGFDVDQDGFVEIYPAGAWEPRQVTINVLP